MYGLQPLMMSHQHFGKLSSILQFIGGFNKMFYTFSDIYFMILKKVSRFSSSTLSIFIEDVVGAVSKSLFNINPLLSLAIETFSLPFWTLFTNRLAADSYSDPSLWQ